MKKNCHTTYSFLGKICSVLVLFSLFGGQFRLATSYGNNSDGNHADHVLLCLSAHPDDEDGAALAYYGKVQKVKTYSIFFTRGEGGQNEIGSGLYEDLGNLRTHETLEAAKILGTECYFLGFPDFGFSKTATETFAKWGGKDSVLARLVYFIRALKPDVIITNHDTVTTLPNRQHGNHQAAGITAYEAFEKAADPAFHAEQLKDGITPWQVKKLFFRVRGIDSTKRSSAVTEIDVTQRDSTGTSIDQIAIEALHKHRSQGLEKITLATIPQFFRRHVYTLIRGDREYVFSKRDLFSGITPSARNAAIVQNVTLDTASQPSLDVSPSFLPLAIFEKESTQEIHQSFVVTIINRAHQKHDLTLNVHSGKDTKSLFLRPISTNGERTADTLDIPLEKNTIASQKTLHFELAPSKSQGAESPRADAVVTFKAVSANYDHRTYVGLVETYDNTLEEMLASFNVNFHRIDSISLAAEDLAKYSLILLDLRAYEFRTDVAKYSNRLLQYVYDGGNVVCFYHKTIDWNNKGYAPFPITVTSERVTEEDAPVTPLLPNHPLLSSPNKITSEDWNGWVQERSIYLPSQDTNKTSSRYLRLLAMSDENEHQPPTSLLWAEYGKGTYTYCSLALYRQLRILNDAAVKLLFNMISQPRH